MRSPGLYGLHLTDEEVDQLFQAYSSCSKSSPHHVSKNKASGKHRRRKKEPVAQAAATAEAPDTTADEREPMKVVLTHHTETTADESEPMKVVPTHHTDGVDRVHDQPGVVQGETSHSEDSVVTLLAKVSAPEAWQLPAPAMAQGVGVYRCPGCGFEFSPGLLANVGFQYSIRTEGTQADESVHCGWLSDAHATDGAWGVPRSV